MFVLLAAFVASGQLHRVAPPATVQGSVRDSHDLPIEAAIVHVQPTGSARALTVLSDSKGGYRCLAPAEGIYILRAEKSGYAAAAVGPFKLARGQAVTMNLTLTSKTTTEAHPSPSSGPEFYDEPSFTVAGVTDTLNHGGHGSDTVSRTAQSLTRDIVALDKSSSTSAVNDSMSAGASEQSLRHAAVHDPTSFEANQKLGIYLAQAGQPAEALPYLERAHQIRGDDYQSARELARADAAVGRYEQARQIVHSLLARQNTADLHHLLGDIKEKQKNPLEAVREYQLAAELDPTETNLFDWATELLTHRALAPAVEVFTKGSHLFPQSARMLVGLGVAWYASGSSDLAAKYLCQASDLKPTDPNPYLALGRMQIVESAGSQAVFDRLERFVRLQPESAQANYYYAVSLWKLSKTPPSSETFTQVESFLQKAVRLDPGLAPGFLKLGVLYDDRGDLPKAISAYQSAVAADSQLGDARYRLAQAYRRAGESLKAEQELASYQQISRHAEEQAEREAREIPQFVYTLRDSKSPAPPK
jgi:tetratricopeptide (TPR) repeat protein